MKTRIHLQPRTVGFVLGTIAIVLAFQSIFNEFLLETFVGSQSTTLLATVLDLFSVNLEESIPTWYSTINLMIAAMLFAWIAWSAYQNKAQDRFHWIGLAVVFAYLSMDEGAAIHEILADPLQVHFQTTGWLSFGWQIAAIPLVVIFGLLYVRFVFRLPSRTRNLLILSAGLYAGGALFVEGMSANQWSLDDGASLTYLAIATVEELCEMLGVVVLIYTLLDYMTAQNLSFEIDTQPAPPDESADQPEKPKRPLPAYHTRRAIIALVSVWVVMNVTFLYLSIGQIPEPEIIEVEYVPFYQAMIDDYDEEELVVSYVPGIFGMQASSADNMVTSIADSYDALMIVALPGANRSVVFAGEELPFTRDEMAEVLHEKGHLQFIIFENDLVRQLISGR